MYTFVKVTVDFLFGGCITQWSNILSIKCALLKCSQIIWRIQVKKLGKATKVEPVGALRGQLINILQNIK